MATELRVVPVENLTVLPVDGGRFMVDTLTSPQTLYLPHEAILGVSFRLYDYNFNAATNNITIKTLYPQDLINGLPQVVINQDGRGVEIFKRDLNRFMMPTGSGGSGGSGVKQIYNGPDADPNGIVFPDDQTILNLYSQDVDAGGTGTLIHWNPATLVWDF